MKIKDIISAIVAFAPTSLQESWDNAGLLVCLSLFLPEDTAAAIKSGPKSWKIKYSKYDWSLNEQ